MSNYDFSYLTTRELLEKALNGELPIPRYNAQNGESKYFFMKTGEDPYASISDAEVFDVPDDEDPFEFRDNGYQSSILNSSQTIGDPSLSSEMIENSLNTFPASSSIRFQGPNCYMNFDGQNLDLYNNGLVNRLSAQSGQDDFQSAAFQSVKNKGPIPEGTYYANQDERQNIDIINALAGIIYKGNWKGSLPSWGLRRVWLNPDENTNTYGRDGFSIHGGLTKGSAGCIDIPWQTDELRDYLDACQFSVPVHVKYPWNW